MTDVNPGEVWKYRDIEYNIVNTGLLTGSLRDQQGHVTPVIVYRRDEEPLLFVRERHEFIRKFTQVTKRKIK